MGDDRELIVDVDFDYWEFGYWYEDVVELVVLVGDEFGEIFLLLVCVFIEGIWSWVVDVYFVKSLYDEIDYYVINEVIDDDCWFGGCDRVGCFVE